MLLPPYRQAVRATALAGTAGQTDQCCSLCLCNLKQINIKKKKVWKRVNHQNLECVGRKEFVGILSCLQDCTEVRDKPANNPRGSTDHFLHHCLVVSAPDSLDAPESLC